MTKLEELATLVAAGRATAADMTELGADCVAAIKTNPELPQYRVKASEPISINTDRRTISYLVSDETVDRMGDIIRVKGWDLENYRKNPVILWSHDGKSVPPIGRANNVRRRYGPDRLTADIEFAPAEAHEFADTIYQLASRGFIRATSVGFLPTETEEVNEKQREALGVGPYGQIFSSAELMEISVVAVPANPSALQDGVKALTSEGLMDHGRVARFLETYPANEEVALKRVRAACRAFVDFGAKVATSTDPEVDAAEKKSPACRTSDESEGECVSRKIPELKEEGMKDEQAVAAAHSMCATDCEEKQKEEVRLVDAVSSLIEQQAEQTRATRQLVDSLTDLTKTLHGESRSGTQSGSDNEPDAGVPEADGPSSEQIDRAVNGAVRGFAERIRRDILSNTNPTKD